MEPVTHTVTDITSVDFGPDGIGIGYVRVPADVRKNGLMWQHHVMVPHGSDYDDEIETFKAAAFALLEDALDDEGRAEPIDPPEEQDEEDNDDDE